MGNTKQSEEDKRIRFAVQVTTSAFRKMDRLLRNINAAAKKHCDLPITQTILFAKMVAAAPPVKQDELDKFWAEQAMKDIEVGKQTNYILPENTVNKIVGMCNNLKGRNSTHIKVLSYIIQTSSITEQNFSVK